MNRTRRDSSAASKSLLRKQLASITDTLAKASQRRDEEVKRTCRQSGALTAATDSTSLKKHAAPVQRGEVGYRQAIPATVRPHGGGAEENSDPCHAQRLVQQEEAEDVRQEGKAFDEMVMGKGTDDREREDMIENLFTYPDFAQTNAQREVLRACLEAEEEKVGQNERTIVRGKEIDEFKDLTLEEEAGMELEDRWKSMIYTTHADLLRGAGKEEAELARLEEGLFGILVAQAQAQDADYLDAVAAPRGSEQTDEGDTRFKSAGSHDSFAMGLSLDGEGERPLPNIPQLRGGNGDDKNVEHHQRSLAASRDPEEAQQEATAPAPAAAAAAAADEKERVKRLQDDYKEMAYRMEACDYERQARVEVAHRRALGEKAARTSGFASDEAFEHMRVLQEAEERELVEMMKRQGQEACSSDADGSEEAVLDKSVEEELSRRKTSTEAKRSYLLPPASPPKHALPPYTATEFELEEVPLQSDTGISSGMRGGHATPIDDNPRALLAELASLRESIQRSEAETDNTVLESNDLRHMLAEFDRPNPSAHTTATAHDNPREMLGELLTLSAPGPRELRSPTSEDLEDNDDDINALRARLEKLWTPGRSVTPAPASFGSDEGRDETTISSNLPSEAIPHAIAQGWTQSSSGSYLNSYQAQEEKEIAVAHAEEALRKMITSVMKVEDENHRKAEEIKCQRRLIVSNLAADAEVKLLGRQFRQYRSDIVNITMLPERDALKRTQTAHVDFCSRKSAVLASFLSGQIYGLIFDVRLAVPVE